MSIKNDYIIQHAISNQYYTSSNRTKKCISLNNRLFMISFFILIKFAIDLEEIFRNIYSG